MEKIIPIYLRKNSALHNLMKDKNIITKPAYKGSTTVIWNKESYLKQFNGQLSNKNVYEKCNEFSTVQLHKEL